LEVLPLLSFNILSILGLFATKQGNSFLAGNHHLRYLFKMKKGARKNLGLLNEIASPLCFDQRFLNRKKI
jgi:hypothetical protein